MEGNRVDVVLFFVVLGPPNTAKAAGLLPAPNTSSGNRLGDDRLVRKVAMNAKATAGGICCRIPHSCCFGIVFSLPKDSSHMLKLRKSQTACSRGAVSCPRLHRGRSTSAPEYDGAGGCAAAFLRGTGASLRQSCLWRPVSGLRREWSGRRYCRASPWNRGRSRGRHGSVRGRRHGRGRPS